MALIGPWSTCAICGGGLDRPYTATSGVAFPPDHPLWPYCDAPLHWGCLTTWADREEFSRGYFVGSLCAYWSGCGTLLRAAPDWFLACGPAEPGEPPYFAEVRLAAWPLRLYSEWKDWSEYVDDGFRASLSGPALDAADAVMAQVRREVPSLEALEALRAECSTHPAGRRSLVEFGDYLATLWGEVAHRTDWRALEHQRRAAAQALAVRERARAEAIARSNEIARRLAVELASGSGLACPHCHRRTRQMRFYDRARYDKSYFVCRLCGRSFAGLEASEDG